MEAGVANQVWSLDEVIAFVLSKRESIVNPKIVPNSGWEDRRLPKALVGSVEKRRFVPPRTRENRNRQRS
jgi:hypothetical protein